jgi:hypothetical protein
MEKQTPFSLQLERWGFFINFVELEGRDDSDE